VWHFVDGTVVAVDEIEGLGRWVRHYVVDGRWRWLTADPTGTEGLGSAVYAAGGRPATDFAGAIAAWLDRDLAASDRVVVFADGENAWQRTLRLMRHPGLRGVSVLHNSHLDAPYDATAPTKPHWEGFFSDVTNVTAMVCLTHRQRRDLLERYPDLPLRVLRHAAARPRVPRVRPDPRRVVSLGRLAPQKQLDHLLRAFALVLERVPDARLDLYGDGPSHDDLVALAAELQIAHAIRFLGRTDRALEAFASARVAVMTSLHEGLPLTLTEAMSVGTPFVAYDCNYGPAEVLRDGENGFLVPMGDVDTVADRIVRVLEDDRLARRLGRAARRVTKEFSFRRYRSSWLGLLEEVARASSSSTINSRT
jgi:glycosyltransferase involved in cell wall biosynthesis